MSEHKPKNSGLLFAAGMLALFAVLFAAGSFCDLYLAQQLYRPLQPLAFCVTSFGLYPYFAAYILIFGVLCRQAELSALPKIKKTLLRIVCVYLTFSTGTIGGGILLSRNCLAAVYPALNMNIPLLIAIDFLFMLPVFLWGRRIQLPYSRKLVKRLIRIVVVMLSAFVSMELIKAVLLRPRYRIVASGEADFVPWFQSTFTRFAFVHSGDGEYGSFPSGHSVSAACYILIFYSLPLIFPRLRGKELSLAVIGLVCGLCVMLSRMVLGAHYLSDVSSGAFLGTLAFLVDRLAAAREKDE